MRKEDSAVRRRVSDELTDALKRAADGDHAAVYQALAEYERHLSEKWHNYEEGEYWGVHRVFFGAAVNGLETAVLAKRWPYLLDALEAYWPENSSDFETYPEHEPLGGGETDDYEHHTRHGRRGARRRRPVVGGGHPRERTPGALVGRALPGGEAMCDGILVGPTAQSPRTT